MSGNTLLELAKAQVHLASRGFFSSSSSTNSGEAGNKGTMATVARLVTGSGNSVEAFLGTNVSYSPFVRNASHSKQFFAYAADVEGPHVQKWLGDEVDLRVERGFNN